VVLKPPKLKLKQQELTWDVCQDTLLPLIQVAHRYPLFGLRSLIGIIAHHEKK
jgi:hypothetical protein